MTSNDPKHIEASSNNQKGIEHSKAPCSSELQPEKSSSAATEKSALDSLPARLN
ncbi:hypothetical protein UC8_38240 [Roseimaritima ulvae]|uniref:Uncharacterized protein n=1 Tax=Roseimaritima ulvae TaxID=980254 RepID=A0A5B9QRY1_9BACT|nr:hypothetical protein UC8_38240 [Roseimaritima ulvae]